MELLDLKAMAGQAADLYKRGELEQAESLYLKILDADPDLFEPRLHMGLIRLRQGRPQDACDYLVQALRLSPGDLHALIHYGLALRAAGRLDEAVLAFDRVLAIQPNMAESLYNRGIALWQLKRPTEALESIERALALDSYPAEVWRNRGLVLRDLARFDEATVCFDTALRLKQNSVTLYEHGNRLHAQKDYEGAIESYSRAIRILPDYAEAIFNRGYTWWALKNFAAGSADVERALSLNPDYPYGPGELLYARMCSAEWNDFDRRKAELERLVRAGKRVVQPFIFQAIAETPVDAQTCSRIWGENLYPQHSGRPHDPAKRKNRQKIRLGYLSGEFRQQATAVLMAGLYERHDRDKFEIVAVNAGGDDGSRMRSRLVKAFDRWLDIGKLSDQEAADVIREAEIDILVSLNGYFGEVRMGVFARRPAPIQVNYLGFPGTLGMPYIDYIIADKVVIPKDEQRFYDENVVYLPDSYQANDDKGREIAATPSRAEAGLPSGGFVFCNFNNPYKLTPATFASWMRILKQVEGSVIWLLEGTPPYAENLRRAAEKRGVTAGRLIFARYLPVAEHLARLQLADLFLDSLPYNAHTTASDALWTGVPLVTCKGPTFPGRVAASLLLAAGLPELVTESAADFEALAVRLARDGSALKALRDKLMQDRSSCALFDTDRFRRNIEAAYRVMWDGWLASQNPQGFAI